MPMQPDKMIGRQTISKQPKRRLTRRSRCATSRRKRGRVATRKLIEQNETHTAGILGEMDRRDLLCSLLPNLSCAPCLIRPAPQITLVWRSLRRKERCSLRLTIATYRQTPANSHWRLPMPSHAMQRWPVSSRWKLMRIGMAVGDHASRCCHDLVTSKRPCRSAVGALSGS